MVDFTQCELIWSVTSNWTNTRNLHSIISYRFVCRICTWESSSMCYINSCKNRYTSEAVTLDVATAHGCKCSQYKRTVVMFFSPVCPLPQFSLPCHCLLGTWSGGRPLWRKKKNTIPSHWLGGKLCFVKLWLATVKNRGQVFMVPCIYFLGMLHVLLGGM